MKLPWKKGPTAPYLDGKMRYRVYYRTRGDEWSEWKPAAIEMVEVSPGAAKKRAIKTVRGYHPSIQMEVMHVAPISAEAPIQTGRTVEAVSQSDYESMIEERQRKTEYERKQILRGKGLWLPK